MAVEFKLIGSTQEERSRECLEYFSGFAIDMISSPYYVRMMNKGNYVDSKLGQPDDYKQRFVKEIGRFIETVKSQDPPIELKTQKILEGFYKTWIANDWKTQEIETMMSQMQSLSRYISKKFSGTLPADPTKRRMAIMEGTYQELQLERLKPHSTEYVQ
jgi:hypothetical protein